MIKVRERLHELSALTLPLLVEHAFVTLMGMVNTAMVASLGEEALAAAGHVSNASFIPIALFSAMITGGTILVAQAIGARDTARAQAAGGQAVTLAVAFSILLAIILTIFQRQVISLLFGDADPRMIEAGYIYYTYINWSLPFIAVAQTLFGVMRGAGDVRNPMKITLLMNVVNIVLSYVLILGVTIPIINFNIPSLGMHGAGLAIAIARLVGPIWAFKVIFSPKSGVCLNKLKFYMPTGQMQKNIMTLGVPTGIEQLLFQAGRMGTLMFMIGMGTAVMAANVVAMNIMGFIMIPGNALTISLMVMVGQRIGRKDFDDIVKVSYFSVAVGASFMAVLSLIMLPTGGFFITVFGLDTEAAGYFNQLYLSLIIGGPLLWPLSFIIPSALRAAEDVKFTMIVSVSSMWLFRIALGYYLGIFLGYGVMGVWIGLYGDWAARSVIFLFRLNRKKWLRKFI